MAVIIVGMAEFRVCKSPDTLTTLGLGSCVGVCLYDRTTHIIGMAHVMLPSFAGPPGQNRAKFADCAIIDLVEMMEKMGAKRAFLTAKLAGGAHMFAGSSGGAMKVGQRNVKACMQILEQLHIPIVSTDTGGTYGRTVEFMSDSGNLRIKSVGAGEKII